MKVIATICQINNKAGVTPIALSPRDDVWFVPIEDAPDVMEQEAKTFMPSDRGQVLGFILVSDEFEP